MGLASHPASRCSPGGLAAQDRDEHGTSELALVGLCVWEGNRGHRSSCSCPAAVIRSSTASSTRTIVRTCLGYDRVR